jgi:hypothetical protein
MTAYCNMEKEGQGTSDLIKAVSFDYKNSRIGIFQFPLEQYNRPVKQ